MRAMSRRVVLAVGLAVAAMPAWARYAAGIRTGGKTAILTTLHSASIFQGQTEVDILLTVAHPNGIL